MLTKNTVEQLPVGALVHQYLLASFAYYIMHTSPMTDDAFDYVCEKLLQEYDNFEHQHKKYIDKEALKAGTAYHMKETDYPSIVQHSADLYVQACLSGKLEQHYLDMFKEKK
jgi:hypothetical protein